MPEGLTEEERQEILLRRQQSQPQATEMVPGGLPPAIAAIVSGQQGAPYPTSFPVGKMRMAVPPPEAEMQRRLRVSEAQNRQKELSKARQNLTTYTNDAMQMLTALEKMEAQSKALGDFERGVPQQIGARISTGIGKFAKDKNITRYSGVVAQELIPAARKLMEEKGPITEFDIARVEKGLGDMTTPLEDKVFLLGQLRKKVLQAIENKREAAGMSPEEFSSKYQTLSEKINTGASGLSPEEENIVNNLLGQ